ncbi:hypothetical protein SAMD00019534_102900 [Acytostelium subglobosum LB1]|uniref:hypothetical protein n=1 Tax=Acytostelium subglobosum LB1 TaxID=1410327 RepID=UPI0006447ADA|nr:hypothetical protein SAMD00019534_102900 [Acytostelium subglobosum LB1]GAM27115.1 hypothetical protein SAMD00019534_102900 [Acytostelium subglobosum LB1]|eukprot:XP_012749995.1 hypothetical protein SAMD00019534_102900 [Acytostelium subglobosum LB1]
MYNFKTQQLLLLLATLLLLSGSGGWTLTLTNAQYVHMLHYTAVGCSSDIIKASSYKIDSCYAGVTGSYGYTMTTANQITFNQYLTPNCTGAVNKTDLFTPGKCSMTYLSSMALLSDTIIIPTVSKNFYEKYPVGFDCNNDNAARHSMISGYCVPNDVWKGQVVNTGISMAYELANVQCLGAKPADFATYLAGCSAANLYNVANAFSVTSPLSMSVQVSVTGYDSVSVTAAQFSGWIGMGHLFEVFYSTTSGNWARLNQSAGTGVAQRCYSTLLPCTISSIPIGTSVSNTVISLKFVLAGIDYFASNTPPSYTAGGIKMPSSPTMQNLVIKDQTTSSITFNYTAAGGYNGLTFVVTVNSLQINTQACTTGPTCTVTGLPVASQPVIVVYATSSGRNSPSVTQTGQLLKGVTMAPLTVDIGTTRKNITVHYVGSGGDIRQPYSYSTYLNGTLKCNTTASFCSVTGLSLVYYDIKVVATNDGQQSTQSTSVNLAVIPLQPPNITAIIGTTHATIQFYASGGEDIIATVYNVTVNGVLTCIKTLQSTCEAKGLAPFTTYSVQVTATKGATTTGATFQFQTYQSVDMPTVIATQNLNNTVTIQYFADHGVPFNSTFTVRANGTLIPLCVNTTATVCQLFNPNLGQYYQFSVNVYNDGASKTAYQDIMLYTYPTTFSITKMLATMSSIDVEWNASTGGAPDSSYYTTAVSLNKVVWSDVCVKSLELSCQIKNLLPNTIHYIRVTMTNYIFTPVVATSNNSTLSLPVTINYCLNAQGVSCSGNGNCTNNICLCNNQWKGQYCEERISDQNTNNGTIGHDPNSPGINVTSKGVYFSFAVNKIIERDSVGIIVKQLNMTNLVWFLMTSSNSTVTVPTTNDTVLETRLTYISNTSTNPMDSIEVTFLQYHAIQGVTRMSNVMFEFANQQFTIDLGSIKYNVAINKWKFTSYLNTLEIHSTVSRINGGSCDETIQGRLLNNGPISTMNITDSNGNNIVGRFINRVVLDQTPRLLNLYELDQESKENMTIVAVAPAFSQRLEMDPDFGFLVRGDSSVPRNTCHQPDDNKWKLITGVVVGGVVLLAVAITATIFILKRNAVYIKHHLKLNKIKNDE